MREYEPRFSLEHEQNAFEELKKRILKIWENKESFYAQLKEENTAVRRYSTQNKIKLIETESLISEKFKNLFWGIKTEIIDFDPILSSSS